MRLISYISIRLDETWTSYDTRSFCLSKDFVSFHPFVVVQRLNLIKVKTQTFSTEENYVSESSLFKAKVIFSSQSDWRICRCRKECTQRCSRQCVTQCLFQLSKTFSLTLILCLVSPQHVDHGDDVHRCI